MSAKRLQVKRAIGWELRIDPAQPDGPQLKLWRCPMPQLVPTETEYPRILVAEDDTEMRSLLVWVLHKAGYDVVECRNGLELAEHLHRQEDQPHDLSLVISDIRMPGQSALEVLHGLKHQECCPPVILITAFGDEATHREAVQCGVVAIFDKPFDTDQLVQKVYELVPHEFPNSEASN